MPDTPPTPPTPPAKPKRTRSVINQAWAAELTLAGELATVASQAEYSEPMADEEIDADWLTALRAKITAAQAVLNAATGGTADKTTATRDEEGLKKALLAALRQVQQRAKRKYKPENPQRQKYFINASIEDNRATLEEAVDNVLRTLATDTLPGLKPAHKTALTAALAPTKASKPPRPARKAAPPPRAASSKRRWRRSPTCGGKSNTPPTPSGPPRTRRTPAPAANSKSRPTRRWREHGSAHRCSVEPVARPVDAQRQRYNFRAARQRGPTNHEFKLTHYPPAG